MPQIHPTSQVSESAHIAEGVFIGPFCVVGPHVVLERDVRLESHVSIEGHTTVGEGTRIFPFASIGSVPQDLKFKGELSQLHIGKHNTIREYVTMSPGTEGGGGKTLIGDHNLFMVHSHVGHDCVIGNHCVFSNGVAIAGHVHIEDHAIMGGLSAVRQFARVGAHAMVGGMSGVERDIPPYVLAIGNRAQIRGLNLVGLRRRGFDNATVKSIKQIYHHLFEDKNGTLKGRVEKLKTETDNVEVQRILDFVENSELGLSSWMEGHGDA